MHIADTLALTFDLETPLIPRSASRLASRSVRCHGAFESRSLPMEQDLILATVPTVRGFKLLGGAALYGRLGRGGSGAVYRARHLELGIDVAVKCLLPAPSMRQAGAVARFEREVALTASLDHPNVVQVLDSGKLGDLHYLVMEYVHGETLRRRVRRMGSLPWEEALAIAKRAARGLAAAHRLALIHRDVKPDNIMVGRAGEVKVCDLGLVKAQGPSDGLTQALSLLGTPRYMAPEQWKGGHDVGPAADVYGLGCCLYFMLTGQDARRSRDFAELRRKALEEPYPDVRVEAPCTPTDLALLLERCVARDPKDRYQDGGELVRALDAIDTTQPACLLDGGAETVPFEHRSAGPAYREEVALRRAVARRSHPLRAVLARVSPAATLRMAVVALAWGAGWACAGW